MASIWELLGYELTDLSSPVTDSRIAYQCPFVREFGGTFATNCLCKAGNRNSQVFFSGNNVAVSSSAGSSARRVGICSIAVPSDAVWMVCPDRMFVVPKVASGQERMHISQLPSHPRNVLAAVDALPNDTPMGIWAEVKMKDVVDMSADAVPGDGDPDADDATASIDSRFDYIINPIVRATDMNVWRQFVDEWRIHPSLLNKTRRWFAGRDYVPKRVEGFPIIMEVMTASTSGSNRDKAIGITYAFKSAWDQFVKGAPVGAAFTQSGAAAVNPSPNPPAAGQDAPSMNRRQTWARMASQLVAKSEFGVQWGGKTVWLMQETLLSYIERSTKINRPQPISGSAAFPLPLSEVNILSLEYSPQPIQSGREWPIALTQPRELAFRRMIADQIPGNWDWADRDDWDVHGIMHALGHPRSDKLALQLVESGVFIVEP